jgi:hypothetical protein
MGRLEDEIRAALNRFSAENGSNTPDFVLAAYLLACLGAFDDAVKKRAEWYARAVEQVEHHAEEHRQ